MKGKALRRALETDALRVNAPVPLISDTTELITPQIAHEMLKRNKRNRPINWTKVEEYSEVMKRGAWALHAQGIVLDTDGNILTGQKRLWAVIYSGVSVYFRVSRGNPPETASLLDRGTPQSARDLASRETGRKHSPVEGSVARAYLALLGNLRPDTDTLAHVIGVNASDIELMLDELKRTKKTKALLMILGAICALTNGSQMTVALTRKSLALSDALTASLLPHTPEQCWNRGAAFGLAMEKAKVLVEGAA